MSRKRVARVIIVACCSLAFGFALIIHSPAPAQRARVEPIAYIGHGAMFDASGREILPKPQFVASAQDWYFSRMIELTANGRRASRLKAAAMSADAVPFEGQARLVARQALLESHLFDSGIEKLDPRLPGKVGLLGRQLRWQLPGDDQHTRWEKKPFEPGIELQQWLKARKLDRAGGGVQFLVTTNSGAAYIQECRDNRVPIPPSIGVLDPAGLTGWKIEGLIPQGQQFIVATPAQLRSFRNDDGVCIALPRFRDASMTIVDLDGVICQSRITSKVCFWDNQMAANPATGFGQTFDFPAGAIIPIGVPDTPGGLYQAGGKEIEFGQGGECTDCHAGENPYIVHPDAVIRTVGGVDYTFGELSNDLPLFAPGRYEPIVGASWWQNDLSHSPPLVPPECVGCHQQGDAGRLPHLSTRIGGFCGTVLRGAVTGVVPALGPRPPTMPQFSPGSFAGDPGWPIFNAYCGTDPTAGPSDRGDPHLVTTNSVAYDFQAAGEFTALRNTGTKFEMQTRQTPVVTSFIPGPNPYTGLQSCVSLNTAVAVRMGKHRISFQPADGDREGRKVRRGMVLRIDGKVRTLPPSGIDLGDGNRIASAGSDGSISLRARDGTRVVVTPHFWSSQGYWYLDVEVLDTPAREGTLGPILSGNWLPLAPDGSSFGPRPVALSDRHVALNVKFADAWRVTGSNSLFDYAPGTSTATFTDRKWPSAPGGACSTTTASPSIPAPGMPPIKPGSKERGVALCSKVRFDPVAFEQCVFDYTVMGDAAVVGAYARTLSKRNQP